MSGKKKITLVQYVASSPQIPHARIYQYLEIIRRCSREGWRTYLVLSEMPNSLEISRPFLDAGCRILTQRRPAGNLDLRTALDIYRLLRDLRCDVFHCHNIHTVPLAAAALARVPVRIWSVLAMSPYYEQGTRPRGIHRLALSTRLSTFCAHRILAISTAVSTELLQNGAPVRKTAVLPAPVDLARFRRASGDGARQEFGFTEDQVLVIAVGHAVPVKGWDVLIKAFACAVSRCPHARLLLVGSHSDKHEASTYNDLQSLARGLSCAHLIRFAGARFDIPRLLAASDIFVMPSRSEGLGMALVEALAAGLPCVAARVGGIPDILVHGRNGLLFERENVGALAEQLVHLAADTNLRRQLAEAAPGSVQGFGLEPHADNMMAIYTEALQEACVT